MATTNGAKEVVEKAKPPAAMPAEVTWATAAMEVAKGEAEMVEERVEEVPAVEKEAVEKVVVMVAVVMEEETAAEVRVVVKEEVEKAAAKVAGYNHSILRSLGSKSALFGHS